MSAGKFTDKLAEEQYSRDSYGKELAMLQQGNPAVTEIKNKQSAIVWCFSGRTSVYGRSDGIQKKRVAQKEADGEYVEGTQYADPTDDFDRLLLSIETSRKLGGVRVLYNGTDEENDDLREFVRIACESASLAEFKEKIPPEAKAYLEKNFTDDRLLEIVDIFSGSASFFVIDGDGIKNSLDQVRSFNGYVNNDPDITDVYGVSSAFHLPRLARSISGYVEKGKKSELGKSGEDYNRLSNLNFRLSGSDLECKQPGTVEFDLPSEVNAIGNYIRNGSIASCVSANVSLSVSPEEFRGICSSKLRGME